MAATVNWAVTSTVLTRRGEVPLAELDEQERLALVANLFLTVARTLAPEGVQVRGVRLRRLDHETDEQRRAVV